MKKFTGGVKRMVLRSWILLIIAIALVAYPAHRAGAQVLPAAAGTVGGFFAGTFVMTGTYVLEARLGKYVYGLDEIITLRPEILPLVIGPLAGAMLGATSPETLRRAGTGALIGLAGGAVIGTGVGQLLWETPEGRWAGGIIGGAAGLVAGSVLYAALDPGDGSGAPAPVVAFSLRAPWGGK